MCLLDKLVVVGNAFIVVNFVINCVCELVIYVHCACENPIRINSVVEGSDFFSSCLWPRSEEVVGGIYGIMTFELIGNPLLQTPIFERS